MSFASIVLDTSTFIFPIVLRDVLQDRCEVSVGDIKQFLHTSIQKNSTISPDIVIGSCYSALQSESLIRGNSAIPWIVVKTTLIDTLRQLKRSPAFHSAYSRLFLHLTTGVAMEELVAYALKTFGRYLLFDGSVHLSDRVYLDVRQAGDIDRDTSMAEVLPNLHAEISSRFFTELTESAIAEFTHRLNEASQVKGRVPNREDVLRAVLQARRIVGTTPDIQTTLLEKLHSEIPDTIPWFKAFLNELVKESSSTI